MNKNGKFVKFATYLLGGAMCVGSAFAISTINFNNINNYNSVRNVVCAAEGENTSDGFMIDVNGIGDHSIPDVKLYKRLLDTYYAMHPEIPDEEKDNVLWSRMLKDVEELNLQNAEIETITGLDLLYMPNLKTINLSKNKISLLTVDNFAPFTNLKTINLADNYLSGFTMDYVKTDVSTRFADININLSNNAIRDASFKGVDSGRIDLSYNNIEDITEIKFDRVDSAEIGDIVVDLIGNEIENVENKNKNIIYNFVTNNVVKRDNASTLLTVDKKFNLQKYYGIDNLVYRIFTSYGIVYKEIENSNITAEGVDVDFAIGDYGIVFAVKSGENTYTNLYNETDLNTYKFRNINVSVIPNVPKLKFVYKNKEYDSCVKFTGKAKLQFETLNESDEVYYSIRGGKWQKGKVANIRSGGNYIIQYKVVVDGVESQVATFQVISSLNPYMSDGILIFLIILAVFVMGGLFYVYIKFI